METFLDSYHKDTLEGLVTETLGRYPCFSLAGITAGYEQYHIEIGVADAKLDAKMRIEQGERMQRDLASRLTQCGFGIGALTRQDDLIRMLIAVH